MELKSDPKKTNLTQARVRGLDVPAGGRPIIYDLQVPGFGVRVTPRGVKSFILRRKIDGRAQIVTLGRFPTLGVEKARKIAIEMNGAIARGENPQDLKRDKRNGILFQAMFKEYLVRHARVHNRKASETEASYRRHLKHWANRRLTAITHKDIQALHAQIGKEKGVYVANRLLALLHHLFNQAKVWGYHQGDNPAHGIRKFHETKRERFLQPDELPRFFQALADEPNTEIRDYVLLSLLTGARKTNVLTMRWDEINWETVCWTIPGEKSKHGDSMTIPLHQEVVAILEARRGQGDSKYVLPGPGGSGHLVNPQKGWRRILDRAGIGDLRLHDLRRTLGSYQAAKGASLIVIGRSLGHRNVSTTAIYSRLNLAPVRESMNSAIDAMLEAGEVKEHPIEENQ